VLARDALSLSKGVRVSVLLNRLGRHTIATVDPLGKILKFAALAAEGDPGRFGWLATAIDTHANRHDGTFY
jgi:hypothetical protein